MAATVQNHQSIQTVRDTDQTLYSVYQVNLAKLAAAIIGIGAAIIFCIAPSIVKFVLLTPIAYGCYETFQVLSNI